MSQYSFMIDNMVWSFSRINSFNVCPYEWYLQYIEGLQGENNFYAEFGTYCHKILEKYEKGELGIFDLADYFVDHFDEEIKSNVSNPEKYIELGKSYFENIDLDLGNYEVLGIEKKCDFELEGRKFTGFIDLLLKDKETGEIVLIDHKSSKYPLGKRGGVLKSEAEKFDQYKKQLYIYCTQVYNEYGVFPTKIGWNYFKDQKWLVLDFVKEEYDEAIKWALKTIVEINDTEYFAPNPSFYYCANLCRFRNSYCEFKNYG